LDINENVNAQTLRCRDRFNYSLKLEYPSDAPYRENTPLLNSNGCIKFWDQLQFNAGIKNLMVLRISRLNPPLTKLIRLLNRSVALIFSPHFQTTPNILQFINASLFVTNYNTTNSFDKTVQKYKEEKIA
jgi:hypothetical protein